jgi:dUTP pyrophosphatase
MARMEVPVRLLSETARMPSRAHEDDAAFDLHADEAIELAPGARAAVATGIALALPPGSCGLVLPRSGLAARHGITVLNAPGLIDPGYRGEVMAILLNTDPVEPFAIERGDRIAQLLIARGEDVMLRAVSDELEQTARGAGGLGSTGR